MSFCRITGKSRSLPKPNYFPLLPPISPADAKRFCRITGKSYGLPSHHFIPVTLTNFFNKKKCKITNVSAELGMHSYAPDILYGKRKHLLLTDFRYVFPVLDNNNEEFKYLIELLNTKSLLENNKSNYVYKVEEKMCSLVFPAQLEAAVRDGDIHDVLLSKNLNSVLLKMKKGKNFSVDLIDYEDDCELLYEGEGPREDVLLERLRQEKLYKKRKSDGLIKFFENKDLFDDEVDLNYIKHKRSKRSKSLIDGKCEIQNEIQKLSNLINNSGDLCNDLFKPLIECWDWDQYRIEADMAKEYKPIAQKLPRPYKIDPYNLNSITEKILINNLEFTNIDSLDCIPLIVPNLPLNYEKPSVEILNLIKSNKFLNQENIEKFDLIYENLLPNNIQILDILNFIDNGKFCSIQGNSGMLFDIENEKYFIPGEMLIKENDVKEFIPGKIVNDQFLPGITLKSQNGNISFIPGFILNGKDDNNNTEKLFMAGFEVENEFQCGQVLIFNKEKKFIEGETIKTKDGLKFIPGVRDNKTTEFFPGQYVKIDEEYIFIPGQTITLQEQNCEKFIPGQNVINEKNELIFIPGQTVNNEFIPGKSIITDEGVKFIPGQFLSDNLFVPGITQLKEGENGKLEFIPGINIETRDGTKFIEGQILKTEKGEIFYPGKTKVDKKSNIIEFSIAKTIDNVSFHTSKSIDFVIDFNTCEASSEAISIFGNMLQTENGIKFYPNKIKPEDLPNGKIIPGKLIKQENECKFIPGILSDDGFIPGQMVWTEKGEKFLPGQVIETSEGLKFVPGQVIDTKSGKKFVPGQTIDTPDGARFVPGQIIQTKSGPTFIPGQIMYTEGEGERFVPGQVVDTEYGPRFVPGRIIETDDKVTFVPGQVVETSEGFKFIAPDLEETEGGEFFSIQSFMVTPEELKLLKSANNWTSTTVHDTSNLTIDSEILKNLSAAGMSIGQQVEASAIDFVLQSTKDKEVVKLFIENNNNNLMHIDQNDVIILFSEIKKLVEFLKYNNNNENDEDNNNNNNNNNNCIINNKQNYNNKSGGELVKQKLNSINKFEIVDKKHQLTIDILTSTVLAVINLLEEKNNLINYNEQQAFLYELISKILEENLNNENFIKIFDSLNVLKQYNEIIKHNLLIEYENEHRESRIGVINEILSKKAVILNPVKEIELINTIGSLLENDNEMLESFHSILSDNPKVLYKIVNSLREFTDDCINNEIICDLVKKSIISAINQSILNEVHMILFNDDENNNNESCINFNSINCNEDLYSSNNNNNNVNNIKDNNNNLYSILKQTLNFAKLLNVSDDITLTLNDVLNDKKNVNDLLENEKIRELICRVTLMNKLAKNNIEMKECLLKLEDDVSYYALKTNTTLSELVRKSGLLMIDTINIKNNKNNLNETSLPMSIFLSSNLIAMEDYLIRLGKRSKGAFLILKNGTQMVVPRERSHDVITGKCAFTVYDDKGITHFEPLHVFSLIKLKNRPLLYNRFSMYSCDMVY